MSVHDDSFVVDCCFRGFYWRLVILLLIYLVTPWYFGKKWLWRVFILIVFGLKLKNYNWSSDDYIAVSSNLEEKMLGKEESRKLLTLLNAGEQLPFDDIIVNFNSSFPRSRVYGVCSSLAILLADAELPSQASYFWMSKLFVL